VSSVDVASARHLIATDPDTLVVDVRTPAEFGAAHIREAVNLPLDQVDAHLRRIVDDAGGRMILVCQGGSRAERCRATLAAAGLSDVAVLAGGMNAWAAAGAPLVHGVPRWSLERQVRLVAGLVVLLSVVAALAWRWPPSPTPASWACSSRSCPATGAARSTSSRPSSGSRGARRATVARREQIRYATGCQIHPGVYESRRIPWLLSS
jgi:rhodanese-related sulfurtransferase